MTAFKPAFDSRFAAGHDRLVFSIHFYCLVFLQRVNYIPFRLDYVTFFILLITRQTAFHCSFSCSKTKISVPVSW